MIRAVLRCRALWLILIVAAALIALVGCADQPRTTTPVTTTASATPTATTTPTETATVTPTTTATSSPTATKTTTPAAPTPAVFVLTPLYNINIEPGDITVKVRVANFKVADKLGQPNVEGEGHFIYYLDATPPTTAGVKATTAAGTYVETADTQYIWKNVGDGSHTVSVQLVNNDGTPLLPAVITTIPVPVVTPTPSPSPSETATPSATP